MNRVVLKAERLSYGLTRVVRSVYLYKGKNFGIDSSRLPPAPPPPLPYPAEIFRQMTSATHPADGIYGVYGVRGVHVYESILTCVGIISRRDGFQHKENIISETLNKSIFLMNSFNKHVILNEVKFF